MSEYKVKIISLLLTIGIRSLLLLHTVRFRGRWDDKGWTHCIYKQRVSFNSFSYLRSSIRRARYSFRIIIQQYSNNSTRWKFPKPEERELIYGNMQFIHNIKTIYAPSSLCVILVQNTSKCLNIIPKWFPKYYGTDIAPGIPIIPIIARFSLNA